MKHFLLALQFLTILPVKISDKIREEDYARSLAYFPLVGLVIAGFLIALFDITGFLPWAVRIAVLLIFSIIITGGIHLDGLADTIDGFYGNRPKERILEIMRDSRIGVMGVIAVASAMLLKYTLLLSIPQEILWKALIAMSVFSRFSQSLACLISGPARENGKARNFIIHAKTKDIAIGCAFTLVVLILLFKLNAITLFIIPLAVSFFFIKYSKRKIGGMTGDTIGAVNEVGEMVILFLSLIFVL